jgi:hypothetical protein
LLHQQTTFENFAAVIAKVEKQTQLSKAGDRIQELRYIGAWNQKHLFPRMKPDMILD